MKKIVHYFLVGVIGLASLSACEEDNAVNKPVGEPAVAIDSVPNPTFTSTNLTIVSLSGVVTSSGNLAVTRGAVLDTLKGNLFIDSAMVTAIDTTNGGEGVGGFKMKIFKLKSRVKYYYRLYAKNWKGVSYSPIDSFISAPNQAKLTLENVVNITNSSASLSGKLTANGGESVSTLGFCYGLGKDPDIKDTITNSSFVVFATDTTVNIPFAADISGLINNRTYYVRSFAVNRGGTSYSTAKSFTTLP